VKVRFVIRSDGTVQDVEVVEGSGYPLLDRAAVEAVERAAPFPEPPLPSYMDSVAPVVPIEFKLRKRW